ncbi:thiamine phosphate synthase [Heliobacterium chlorum]|uniref:Thiamine-phosphate synthase n=1 Tax=Heliobacterium chlorum TaxID=2698 RepID=A0ABR7T318_HELCL|nr:thiamine phosphate synthase [Heliobacterium chlorum]MBC9784602.1 thiamine phosphate synthase [Heliobacterium chlorum]
MDKNQFLQKSLPWTYLVTDRRICGDRSLFSVVEKALRGGVNVVQYREKEASTRQMIAEAGKIHELCRKYGALFIVNDRIDVALAVKAPGVHLGQEDMSLPMARRILGSDVIIGISASSVEEAQTAEKDGADYVGASAVFATPTKEEAPALGLAGLAQISYALSIPVVAIGGIHRGNAADVMAAGSSGVAVVSAVMAAEDPEEAARLLAKAIGSAEG